MRTIWLACCACGDYGLLQQEVEGRDPGAQVLRVGDLEGLLSMSRALSSRRGAAIISAGSYGADDVRETVARLSAEGRCGRVVVLLDELNPQMIEGLFRAGATEVVAARSVVAGKDSTAPSDMSETYAEGKVCPARLEPEGPHALKKAGPGAPRATGGPRPYQAVTEHVGQSRDPYGGDVMRDVPDCLDRPVAYSEEMGYVHGVNLLDELDEVEGYAPPAAGAPLGAAESFQNPQGFPQTPATGRAEDFTAQPTGNLSAGLRAEASPAACGHRAPLISVISGSGGCGKSTVVAAMAYAASLLGLRAAVLDLDLMFGNLYDLMGVDVPVDMASLVEPSGAGVLDEASVVAAAMRAAPGVTLWGPVAAPERAELMARPVELLIDVLRRESDVIFVDTSVFWGDAVAAAVALSDRCLVVGDGAVSSTTLAARAIDLACRVGVPRTRMTAVFNRFGAKGADEEVAMRFELTCALSSKVRIADGGQELSALLAFGRVDEAVGQTSAFAKSVREATREMLIELGCAVGPWTDMVTDRVTHGERPRIRLPWRQGSGSR